MIISLIAAMGMNRVIGKDNDIPWHLPDDFKYFSNTTKEHFVIMGRKNWESLPHKFKPLPNRTNIIITRKARYKANGAIICNSLEEGLEKAKNEKEVFVIGGGEIYRIALKYAHKIYLTEINGIFKGEITFPEFSLKNWEEITREHHPKDSRHLYSFDYIIYNRKLKNNAS